MPNYTTNDYQRIHEIVIAYQNNEKDAANKLVEAFSNYIKKYVNLICYCDFKIEDDAIRKFLALYMQNSLIRKFINRYKYKHSVKAQIYETANKINLMFAKYSPDEIKNELVIVLLQMAKRYKDTSNPSFHNYVDKCFHFEAFRQLNKLNKDPLTKISNNEYMDNLLNEVNKEHAFEFDKSLDKVQTYYNIKHSTHIMKQQKENDPYNEKEYFDFNWINGITCSDIFKDLNSLEREIIVMYYIENKTDQEIADYFGLCRATINKKRLKAKSIIEENAKLTLILND